MVQELIHLIREKYAEIYHELQEYGYSVEEIDIVGEHGFHEALESFLRASQECILKIEDYERGIFQEGCP